MAVCGGWEEESSEWRRHQRRWQDSGCWGMGWSHFASSDLRSGGSQQPITALLSHHNTVSAVSFSPLRGPQLLSSSYDGSCKVWDIRAKVPLLTLRPTTGPVKEEGQRAAVDRPVE